MRTCFHISTLLLLVLVPAVRIAAGGVSRPRHPAHHRHRTGASPHRARDSGRNSEVVTHPSGKSGRRRSHHRETAAERKSRLHAAALRRHPYSMGPVIPEISPERATAIQEALARAGYAVPSTGVWDTATEEAMRRFQVAHRWQHKFVPDARALIALGLGPHYEQPAATVSSR